MTAFDFSSYVHCPRGWRIIRADSELWLDHLASDRVYMIRSEIRGEFELYYTNILNKDPAFVMRTDSLFVCFKRCGLLMPQPSQLRKTRLTLGKTSL